VWLFLVVIEWLADRFAGWLRHGWAAYWYALRMQAAVHDISAKWGETAGLGYLAGKGVPLLAGPVFAAMGVSSARVSAEFQRDRFDVAGRVGSGSCRRNVCRQNRVPRRAPTGSGPPHDLQVVTATGAPGEDSEPPGAACE
jgi:hypothetical protein